MKHIRDFDSLDDFGMDATFSEGGVSYTTPQRTDLNPVYIQDDGSAMVYSSLDTILSGGEYEVSIETSLDDSQAEIEVDTNVVSNLVSFGSLYSYISKSINNIKTNYPNGFTIYTGNVGVNTFQFDNDETYWYGRDPYVIGDFTKYKLIQVSASTQEVISSFTIVNFTSGRTFNILYLDGQPSVGSDIDHIVMPDDTIFSEFYTSLSQYEKDLILPPIDRSNYFPKDDLAERNLVLEGTEYDDFVETELNLGLLADGEDTNYLWRRFYPDGQKLLDDDKSTMRRMILTFAANFDAIYKYQENLKHSHTIGYDDYNHIPKSLVHLLASQWGWSLSSRNSQEDYSKYLLQTYENYATGYTSQYISGKDITFEMWRRVLANLVYLYKKKGTKEGLKYITNIYAIPESLLDIDEYVEKQTNDYGMEMITSPSNIIYVKDDGRYYYVDASGNEQLLGFDVKNTKYLNIAISPASAIEFDFYDWGIENHPDIINVNGVSVSVTGTSQTRQKFFNRLTNELIPSDGWGRYAASYPRLEHEAHVYYSGSVNKFSYAKLEPYIDFLDNNWTITIAKLIPSSSRLLSGGVLYRNKFWNREKYQWNDSLLEEKPLPFNDGMTITFDVTSEKVVNPKATIEIEETTAKKSIQPFASLDAHEVSSAKAIQPSVSIDTTTLSSSKSVCPHAEILPFTRVGEYVPTIEDTLDQDLVESGSVYSLESPRLVPVSGQVYGTTDYENFDTDSAVSSNEKILDMPFSAKGMSEGGYNGFKFELFRMMDEPSAVGSKVFSVLNIYSENGGVGKYKVSSTVGLTERTKILVSSDYEGSINKVVVIDYIDTTTNEIITTPEIGLLNIPVGINNTSIDWFDYITSTSFQLIKAMNINMGIPLKYIRQIIVAILEGEDRSSVESLIRQLGYQMYVPAIIMLMSHSYKHLSASLIVVDYLRINRNLSLNDNKYVLVNSIISNQTRVTFNRVISFFDWYTPTQIVEYNNVGTQNDGDWDYPSYDIFDRSGENDQVFTGTARIGGLNALNADILRDKNEYFLRYKAYASVPSGMTDEISDIDTFSGVGIISSEFDLQVINNVPYYGRYFVYFTRPKLPNLVTFPPNISNGVISTASTSSISISWRGVSDSNRMELQFYKTGGTPSNALEYTGITDSEWTQSGITIPVTARENIGDDYTYTIQTSLEPNTYYWWRIRNFRGKIGLFGHNIEVYTNTEPRLFMTGDFDDGGINSGEIYNTPIPPYDINNDGVIDLWDYIEISRLTGST